MATDHNQWPQTTISGHRPLSKRLSLDTRPTASTSQRPGRIINNDIPHLRVIDDTGKPLSQDRVRRGLQNSRNDDGGSLESDDEDQAELPRRRPQSAWYSRSGRRPQFTLSDLDSAAGDSGLYYEDDDEDEDEQRLTRDAQRRRRKSVASGETTAATSTNRPTGPRASQIPVRSERLHPTTTTHVEQHLTNTTL